MSCPNTGAAALALCILFPVSSLLFAGAEAETTPMMDLEEAWFRVETALQRTALQEAASGEPVRGELAVAVSAFRRSFGEFVSSKLYAEYEGKGFVENREEALALTRALAAAVAAGKTAEAAGTAAIIRERLIAWQRLEQRISGQAYIRLYVFFCVFILIFCGLALTIEALRRSLRRSRKQEQASAAFSRRIMLAQEAERSRIAAELHDTVLQDMTRLRHAISAGNAAGDLLALGRRVMDRTRKVCRELMPPDFSRFALEDSLIQLCIDFTGRAGVECRALIHPGFTAQGYPPAAQLQIYRIAQEALTNIEKHAHADEATLTARGGAQEDPALLICISDDGAGLPVPLSEGLGIRGMRERAAILGADLSFIGGPGGGLTVRLEIPPEDRENTVAAKEANEP
ncbi:MAG: ATP-binding protein [Treponema sp.]|jgi:signal transduction histidine kinase|nr:ATP-binding protein [Treponema sp.]